jgi:UDP-sugar transporter A1/2/3
MKNLSPHSHAATTPSMPHDEEMRALHSQHEEHEREDDAAEAGLTSPLLPVSVSLLPRSWGFYVALSGVLALQNSSYTLVRRFGHGVLKEEATSQSILAVGEMLKLGFCLYMCLRGNHPRPAAGKGDDAEDDARDEPRQGMARRLALTSAPMAVPAIIFLAMNLLSFVALRRISASAFTLIQQSKLIATAVLSRLILGKQLSEMRWRALGTLLCAVLIICYETRPVPPPDCAAVLSSSSSSAGAGGTPGGPPGPSAGDAGKKATALAAAADYLIGVSAVSLEAALSGFSNVYFERVLKSTSLSVWERNVQLAGYSLLIYVPMALSVHPNLLHGWSLLTWLTAFLGALGGVLIGLVITYMDSITKNLALTVAIVLTAFTDHMCFDGPMNLPIIAAAGIVIISILSYTSG